MSSEPQPSRVEGSDRHGPADGSHDIEALVRTSLSDVDHIGRPERLTGGASRETWRLTVDGRPLIMQLQREGDTRDMLVESSVLQAAAAAGVPVPSLLAAGRRSGGGAYMIVEAVEGETIARKVQRDDRFTSARLRFSEQCGAALARVHSIDPALVGGLAHDDQIATYTTVLDELGQPHPTFELTRQWLLAHRPPPPAELRVVHGDFRLGNLIIGSSGLEAVIDWELAHLGDPMEDLGWLCVKAWRFGASPRVGGIGSSDELFAAYTAAGGGPVDPAVVRWWEVLGTWKWGIMCVLQANAHRSGTVRSHELAAIGRRVCENEFDLLDPEGLNLFDLPARPMAQSEAGLAAAPSDRPQAGPHDVPNSSELIEAVREWIDTAVVGGSDDRLRYHGRVAANMLAMVERELDLGPAQAAAHAERLQRLGVASDVELAASIRDGRIDDEHDALAATLLESVVDKLRVANPRYLER